jgi:hypothetical protein
MWPDRKGGVAPLQPPPRIQDAVALELADALLRLCGDDDAVAHAAVDVVVARREVNP